MSGKEATKGLLGDGSSKALMTLTVLGAVAFLVTLRFDSGRAWANLLLDNFYFLSLSIAGTVFIAVQYLAKAGWSTMFRRIPEALTAYLPVGAILLGLSYFGMHDLYHWTHHDAVAHDPVLAEKHVYLNVTMYFMRAAVYIIAWYVLTNLIVSRSRAQDADGKAAHTHTNTALSALFLVVFAFTFSLASVDWIMSLEPHWYSTIFPWYVFGGVFVHGVAVITLILILLRKNGLFKEANQHHFHDLGKYLFAFSVFWAYLWFSQYLLIWYSNIPEETVYFITRSGAWNNVFWLNPLVNLGLPFVLLLPAFAKRSGTRMQTACGVLLLGHWLDLYMMIMPTVMKQGPRFGLQEILIFLGIGSLFTLLFDRAFRAHPAEPMKDPYLAESLHHHVS